MPRSRRPELQLGRPHLGRSRRPELQLGRAALAVLCMLAGGLSLSAHHSVAGRYREEATTIKGTVVQLVYRNPHAYVYVSTDSVSGSSGSTRVWAVECGSPKQIGRGQAAHQLEPGDYVIVTGRPGRDPAMGRLLMTTIVRPRDGSRWNNQDR